LVLFNIGCGKNEKGRHNKKSFLAEKIRRKLCIKEDVMQCSCIQEENVQLIIPANHNYWKETKAALIEKERRKAEALARRQTRSFAY
jgi:hypothetical protein